MKTVIRIYSIRYVFCRYRYIIYKSFMYSTSKSFRITSLVNLSQTVVFNIETSSICYKFSCMLIYYANPRIRHNNILSLFSAYRMFINGPNSLLVYIRTCFLFEIDSVWLLINRISQRCAI